MFPFPRATTASVEMGESRIANNAPATGSQAHCPGAAPNSNAAAASYPPVPVLPTGSSSQDFPRASSSSSSYPPLVSPAHTTQRYQQGYPAQQPPAGYPAAMSAMQYEGRQDTVVQFGEPKNGMYGTPNGQDGYYSGSAAPHQSNQFSSAPPPLAAPPPLTDDVDDQWTREVRRGFIRKVLFIVFFQLLLTTGVSVAFYAIDNVRDYVTTNAWPFWVSWALSLVVIVVLACVPKVNKYPFNYMLLVMFTTFFAVFFACITARYDVEVVAMAFAATAATVLGAWFVAACTPLDLTNKGGILIAILFGVVCVSFIGIFWVNKWLYLIIAMVSAVLFTFYLIYDIQKLMGNRARAYSPDDYVIASLNIYLDIAQIFLNLLQIIGFFSNN